MEDYQGEPSRGCLLSAGCMCFFWAGVLLIVARWLGWI